LELPRGLEAGKGALLRVELGETELVSAPKDHAAEKRGQKELRRWIFLTRAFRRSRDEHAGVPRIRDFWRFLHFSVDFSYFCFRLGMIVGAVVF